MKPLRATAFFLLAAAAAPASAAEHTPPFIADDYTHARAEAVRRKVPLFVEVGARWCYSCRLMRATLADDALSKYAERFVWLDLDYDKEVNQTFLTHHAVKGFPIFFVLDPTDEHAVATQLGAMSLPQLTHFLEQGERNSHRKTGGPADAAVARGDEAAGIGKFAEAASAYLEATRISRPDWPERMHAIDALTSALQASEQLQPCAETAAREAPAMKRERAFVSVVITGFGCANRGGEATWVKATKQTLEPLAQVALTSPSALRDDRFQLYEQMMTSAQLQGDKLGTARWAGRWLDDIEATTARGDDERSALDVARVRAAMPLGAPARILPALKTSERAMPDNYTASARYAGIALAMQKYDEALAASERGLAHVTGAIGRTGLLVTKARALIAKGDIPGGHAVLVDALTSARLIVSPELRQASVQRITQMIEQTSNTNAPSK